jgi:outer membrane biosynthesis protein TonB
VNSVAIDVRVKLDAHGRVTSATPVAHPRNSLESFLAGRAVYAAKQWRFEPAKQDGRPVPGAEIIHFVFDR